MIPYVMTATARAFADIGVPLPAPAADALTLANAAQAVGEANPTAELVDAYTAGNVDLGNLQTTLAATTATMSAAQHHEVAATALANACTARFTTTVRQAAEELIAAMRPGFDAAADVLHTVGRLLGEDPDAAAAIAAGDEAVGAWRNLGAAQNTLGHYRAARGALAECGYGLDPTAQDASWWLDPATVPAAAALERARMLYRGEGDGLRNMVGGGYRLRINTTTEADALVAAAEQATTAATAAAATAAAAANKPLVPYGTKLVAQQPRRTADTAP